MKLIPHLITASGQLDRLIPAIQSSQRQLRMLTAQIAPAHVVDILYFCNPQAALPETGVGAHAADSQTVYLFIDPEHCGEGTQLATEFTRAILHEIHHTLRWNDPGYGETLLEILVSEGLADHFEHDVSKLPIRPWNRQLATQELARIIAIAHKHKSKRKIDFGAWFLGTDPHFLPRWAGYRLGYAIVDRYFLDHPKMRLASSFSIPSSAFEPYFP